MSSKSFVYEEAFVRNLGLVTKEEQQKIRASTIAIPGLGGAGGAHLMAFVRQGFEKFKIADLDAYELKNFNRQYGARMDTVGKEKVMVMRDEALKINPNCQIEVFDHGINTENIEAFLEGVDLCVDAIDAFEFDTRRLYYTEAQKRSIPIIFAAPIGFGTAFLIFMPGGPKFDQYFAIKNSMTYMQKLISFFVGLMPQLLQRSYMKGTNLEEKRGPSSIGAVDLCAGVVVIHAIKILLKKGKIKAVPYYHQFDVMRNKYVVKRLWFGNYGPIQRIKMKLAKYLATD